MKISSQAFANGGQIPAKYTKYGENRIPPIHLEDVPASARSLAMIVDDPDAPKGTFTIGSCSTWTRRCGTSRKTPFR